LNNSKENKNKRDSPRETPKTGYIQGQTTSWSW